MRYLFTLLCCLLCTAAFSQVDTARPPYLRFPDLPPLYLLLGDSVTQYTRENVDKKNEVFLMMFSTGCSHCQQTAGELVRMKEDLKGISIIMATTDSLHQMNAFIERYALRSIPNLVVGRDRYFLLPPFYAMHNFPYMAFYDKKGKLISTFEGSMPLEKVLALFGRKPRN